MNEKAYKTMSLQVRPESQLGCVVMVTGVAAGIISIVSGAKLLKDKKDLRFKI